MCGRRGQDTSSPGKLTGTHSTAAFPKARPGPSRHEATYNDGVPLFEPLFRALNATGARYVVVGGLATVLHGYARLTADVDLVVDLAPEPAGRLVDALVGLGLVPRAPVDAAGFADPEIRERWVRDKGMQVFSFVDRANPMRAVDLFVQYPIDFESLWSRAQVMTLESTTVPVANLDDLITMKRIAGRPQDLVDIEQLERIRQRRENAR